MTDTPTPTQPTVPEDAEQIDVQDYVARWRAAASDALERAIQAEALAAVYKAQRDEARKAVAQALAPTERVPSSSRSEG